MVAAAWFARFGMLHDDAYMCCSHLYHMTIPFIWEYGAELAGLYLCSKCMHKDEISRFSDELEWDFVLQTWNVTHS